MVNAILTYPESETSVFNRYGQLVFRSQGYNTEWDGTFSGSPLPVGTYYYMIDLKTGLEVDPVRLRPHPHEFLLYHDC